MWKARLDYHPEKREIDRTTNIINERDTNKLKRPA
jgi:hypothetical protein